jgi:hypothetical protein
MARLEDLIKDIADLRLRNQIAAEVGKLKARKKFGLVFEQHLPEVVLLPGLAEQFRQTLILLMFFKRVFRRRPAADDRPRIRDSQLLTELLVAALLLFPRHALQPLFDFFIHRIRSLCI